MTAPHKAIANQSSDRTVTGYVSDWQRNVPFNAERATHHSPQDHWSRQPFCKGLSIATLIILKPDRGRTMGPTTVSFVILLLAVGSRAQFPITGSPRAPSPALAPAPAGAIVSANVSGSLGYLCSSRKGILIALQGVASNQNSAGLNVTIPQTLSDATSLSQLSVVSPLNSFPRNPGSVYHPNCFLCLPRFSVSLGVGMNRIVRPT